MRVAFLLLIPLAGCLDAATGEVANIPAPTASVPGELGMRRVFSTGLTAVDRKSSGSRTFARGRVELKLRRDSTLEYHLNVYNPGTDNFTAAHIYRVGRAGPPVVTLFTGAALKDKYIQVRGTGTLIDPIGKPLLEELRANPNAFYVSLRTTREPLGALRGTIQ
jgi:CHRD domain